MDDIENFGIMGALHIVALMMFMIDVDDLFLPMFIFVVVVDQQSDRTVPLNEIR